MEHKIHTVFLGGDLNSRLTERTCELKRISLSSDPYPSEY